MSIEFKNLNKKFDRKIIDNFSFKFEDNGFYTIFGESGSGKTTLLNIISMIESFEGECYFDYKDVKELKEKDVSDLRANNFGYVFQSFNLFEDDTVFNNIDIVLAGKSKLTKEERNERIDYYLNRLGIINLKKEFVKNLSGGEKQRVAIVRALINSPKVILADEPTGNLDYENSISIFEILKAISKDILVICVSHDKELASSFADYILEFKENGKIEFKNNEDKKENKNNFIPLKLTKKKKNFNVNFNFIFRKFINGFKSQKTFQCFIISIFSITLTLMGVSFIFNESISKSIVDGFSKIAGENSLILKRKEDDAEILSYSSANKNELLTLKDNYPSIESVGTKYLNNINEFFIDEDSVYITNKYDQIKLLEGYDINSFNNFHYLKNYKNQTIFPNINSAIDDEIVLGMNNETMKNTTQMLNIEQSYEALGNFISVKNPSLYLRVKNYNWNYEDERLFTLKAVIPSLNNVVYSNNMFFNEYILEDLLMFPSEIDINSEAKYPWVLKKIHYLKNEESGRVA